MNTTNSTGKRLGMGWLPDLPDYRDFSPEHEEIKPMVQDVGLGEPDRVTLPAAVDLRQWLSPIEDQGTLGSCTAQAGAGLIEYYERRAFKSHIDASRLFLYKTTRNLLGWTGDTGAFLRTTMGAMVLFGVCPEKYWPYTTEEVHFDQEPPAFCYAFAQNYQAIKFFRLDPPGTPLSTILHRIKAFTAAGLPPMFGFTVFSSIAQAGSTGKIPFPCPAEQVLGGHGILVAGYDDAMQITNSICAQDTIGALLIRNSWGTGWGDNGYGWLPYDYVLHGMARDWWTLLKKEYIPTKQFGI
jgi:C1A family cysteine protease